MKIIQLKLWLFLFVTAVFYAGLVAESAQARSPVYPAVKGSYEDFSSIRAYLCHAPTLAHWRLAFQTKIAFPVRCSPGWQA